MRIGIFDPYLDDLGGGEKYMVSIAEILSLHHRVDIFWENIEDLKKIAERFSLDISKISLKKNIFSPKFPSYKRYLETLKYDAIIVLSDGSIPIVLSKKLFIHFQQPFPGIRPLFKNSFKKIRVNAFFCNSKYTKSFIDKEFGIKSLVLYPPVDIKAKNLKKENIILSVGRFRVRDVTTVSNGLRVGVGDYKKQGVLVDVFKQMIKNGLKNWKLVIATSVNKDEKEIFEDFKKAAENYPIEFLVNKSNDELWETYSKAKIYWHASGFGENLEMHPEFAEHFGISTVEAMGAGAVPIVINAGGQREIVQNKKNGFLWDNIEELEKITLEMINDAKLLDNISKEAREVSKNFSKEKFSTEINNLILQ